MAIFCGNVRKVNLDRVQRLESILTKHDMRVRVSKSGRESEFTLFVTALEPHVPPEIRKLNNDKSLASAIDRARNSNSVDTYVKRIYIEWLYAPLIGSKILSRTFHPFLASTSFNLVCVTGFLMINNEFTDDPDLHLTPAQAAKYLSISTSTLAKLTCPLLDANLLSCLGARCAIGVPI